MKTPMKFFFDRIDSTNRLAGEWAAAGRYVDPYWIRTDDQYEGKGQGHNHWHSAAGLNLTGSLVIQPTGLDAADQFSLSMSVSLAVLDFLELFTEDVSIKWPNDICLGSEKIGGILIENAISGKKFLFSVIGIGININQREFPGDLRNPVSLCQVVDSAFNLEELEDLLLSCLMFRIGNLLDGDTGSIRSTYLKLLFRYREWAPYRVKDQWINARIVDVDPFGKLMLEAETKDLYSLGFQEVEFII